MRVLREVGSIQSERVERKARDISIFEATNVLSKKQTKKQGYQNNCAKG